MIPSDHGRDGRVASLYAGITTERHFVPLIAAVSTPTSQTCSTDNRAAAERAAVEFLANR